MRFDRFPIVTCILLLLNIAGYIYETRRGISTAAARYGMYQGALRRRGWDRLLLCPFLHTGLMHLACNMLCLVSFGLSMENYIGPLWYLLIYVCGILGSGVFIHFTGGNGRHIGASGAIWALMTATLVMNLLNGQNPLYAFQGIALNLIYSFTARVSWQGHIGGGIGGLASILIMIAAGRINL